MEEKQRELTWIQQAFSPWCREFYRFKGMEYRPTKIDRDWMVELIEMGVQPDEYVAKIKAYLSDPYWKQYGGHKFHILVKNWNQVEIKPQKDEKKIVEQTYECETCGAVHKWNEMCPQLLEKT